MKSSRDRGAYEGLSELWRLDSAVWAGNRVRFGPDEVRALQALDVDEVAIAVLEELAQEYKATSRMARLAPSDRRRLLAELQDACRQFHLRAAQLEGDHPLLGVIMAAFHARTRGSLPLNGLAAAVMQARYLESASAFALEEETPGQEEKVAYRGPALRNLAERIRGVIQSDTLVAKVLRIVVQSHAVGEILTRPDKYVKPRAASSPPARPRPQRQTRN